MPYTHVQFIAYHAPTLDLTEPGDATSDPFTTDAIEHLAGQGGQNEDAAIRAQRMVDVADWARENATNLGGAETLKIFIAPEFYFRAGADGYDEVNRVTNLFAALKSGFHVDDFDHWLIVPGTAFWNQRQAVAGRGIAYFNTVFVVRGGAEVTLSDDDRESAVPVVGSGITNQKAIMSHIDYSVDEDRRNWDGAINPNFRGIIGDWAWRKGHLFQVKGIHKGTDVRGRLVDGGPITFGLEVCLEHARRYGNLDNPRPGVLAANGVLKGVLADWADHEDWEAPVVDVHLITSCGMAIDEDNVCAREDGYVMICDGGPGGTHSRIQKMTDAGVEDLPDDPAPWAANLPGPLQIDGGAFTQRIVAYPPVALP